MRYRFGTLLILLAIGPPLVARVRWTRGETLNAFYRTPPEAWFQLLGLAIAIVVVAAELRRRALV